MRFCGLTGYGIREVVISTAILGGLCALAIILAPWWIAGAVLAVAGATWLWVLWFFRDPQRQTPQGEGLLVSPADGTVTDITPLGPESILGRDGTQIGIFMSIFSVHVNRSVARATVQHVVHQDGTFLDARDKAASGQNESTTIYLTYSHGGQSYPLIMRQIAGLVARRIVTDLREGQALVAGQRIGMIKFGSRMEVLIPRELADDIRVREGQKVQAGLTVLAKTPETSS